MRWLYLAIVVVFVAALIVFVFQNTQSVDISFLDRRGADLAQADQRKLERIFSRGEFRRASPP